MDNKKRVSARKIIEKKIELCNDWWHPYEMVEWGISFCSSLFLQATYHRVAFDMAEKGILEKKTDDNGYIIFRKNTQRVFGEFEEIEDL